MVMTCRHVAQLRDRHLDGELSASLSAEVHAHLLQCSTCRRQFEMYRACGEVIARDRSEPRLRPDFASRVVAQLGTMPKSKISPTVCALPLQTRRVLRERFWRLALSVSMPAAAAVLFLAVMIWPTSVPTGLVAGESIRRATDMPGVNTMTEPTADAVAETVRAANSISQLPRMLVDQARESVPSPSPATDAAAQKPEITLLNALLFPFNEALSSVETTDTAPADDDGIVRF